MRTSIVSITLITPGWCNVRAFRAALRATGRRDRLGAMSNVKMLHLIEPSYAGESQFIKGHASAVDAYSLSAVI